MHVDRRYNGPKSGRVAASRREDLAGESNGDERDGKVRLDAVSSSSGGPPAGGRWKRLYRRSCPPWLKESVRRSSWAYGRFGVGYSAYRESTGN